MLLWKYHHTAIDQHRVEDINFKVAAFTNITA